MPPDDAAKMLRELRMVIARQRRQVDRRLRSIERDGRRLVSPGTYLVRRPAWALAVLGAGLIGAASIQRGRSPRRLRWSLFYRFGRAMLGRFSGTKEPAAATIATAEPKDEEKDGHGN
ncbi:MAG: hypothetical protein GXY83_12635 [Rhodopirellula sp.]|nr:hypothetical protein [Rhodopirellula sp.]